MNVEVATLGEATRAFDAVVRLDLPVDGLDVHRQTALIREAF